MMNKERIILIAILLGYFSFHGIAQDVTTHHLTLRKAQELALTENRKIQNAGYDVQIAKKVVWETTAYGLPQVSAGLDYSNMLDIPVTLMPERIFNPNAGPDDYIPLKFGQQHNSSFSFNVSQLLFSGEYIVGLQASKTYQNLSQQAMLKEQRDVIELVSKSYYGLLFSLENKKVLDSTLFDIQKTYDDISKTYKAGLVEETDVDQIQLNLLTVENALSAIKRQIIVSENIVKYQIGLNITDSIIIEDSLSYIFSHSNVESVMLQEFDLSKNLDYQILQTQKKVSELSVKREKSTFLPNINAFYSHKVTGQNDDFSFFAGSQAWYQSNIIGAGLTWQLFNSGSKVVKLQQAQLELDKIENNEWMLEQGLMFQVEEARNKLIASYDTYIKEKKNVVLAEKIYRRALIKFTNGVISSNELTQLNTQYFNSQSSYFLAMMNVLNSKIELDKILNNY
ncbi:MAG: TolC family protein [Bacteroidales bacterium]|nr:TolC family protein [Bacteroidales bacterium]